MYRRILCVALFLSGLCACGGVAPDDTNPVAGDYSPVEFVFQKDSCDLEDSIRALTDAKYTFKKGANKEDQDSGARDLGPWGAAEAAATDLWSLCDSFPDIRCDWPATIAHLSDWENAAEEGAGCSLGELREELQGEVRRGLFLSEKELVLKEEISIRCPSGSAGNGDDTGVDAGQASCETIFSMRLKR